MIDVTFYNNTETHFQTLCEASPIINVTQQARNQDFMWGGANEAKVD